MHKFLDFEGVLLILGYLVLAFLFAWIISLFKYNREPKMKKYFLIGFSFKIFCCLAYSAIYDFHYNWLGDTYHYYIASQNLARTFFHAPSIYFQFFFDQVTQENIYSILNNSFYYPPFSDISKYAVHRFLSPFAIISGANYYTQNICLAFFLFFINWNFFSYLCKKLTCNRKFIFICVMLIPSIGFWSSGLMKDSFTFSFCLLFITSFAKLFIDRKFNVFTIIALLLSSYIIMQLKVYILYSVIGACMVWLGLTYLQKVKSTVFKLAVAPLILLVVIVGAAVALRYVSQNVGGVFGDVDSMLNKASAAQMDLKQDYYEGEAFDIGDFDGSISSLISLAPKALIAGLFRPHIFECHSVVMILSGLENTALLLLTIWVFFKSGIKFTLKQFFTNSFVAMCMSFAVVLALGIGISTSNFGALVRFKIPLVPFFALGLYEIYFTKKAIKEQEETAEKPTADFQVTP